MTQAGGYFVRIVEYFSTKKIYTSDLHIGHKNIIGFDHRPFSSLDDKRLCLVIRKLNYYQGEYAPWCLYSVSEVSTFKK